MQIPNFTDFLFVSASALNNASAIVASGVEDTTGTLFTPGLANQSNITFTETGLTINVTFTSTARVLFGSGVLAGGYGTMNGTINGVYAVNMSSLVPVSGSVTAYVVATATQIGQQSTLITGPSPGHPDYDPTFVPVTAYLETLDSVILTGTLTVPDNSTTIEICRVTLTSGQVTISSVNTSYQVPVQVINLPTAPPIGSGMDYWGTTAPANYLFAYGQTELIATYPALAAVLGTTYGGDGVTTFGIPDKRGRSSIGKDNMGGTAADRVTSGGSGVDGTTLGAAGGDQLLQAHVHGVTDPTHTHGITDPTHAHNAPQASSGGGTPNSFEFGNNSGTGSTEAASTGITINAAATGISIDSTGGGGSQNLPPGIVCNYIIRAI